MYQMRHVGERLQRNLGTVERTTASRCTRSQLLGAALLALLRGLALIDIATGFVEDLLYFFRKFSRHFLAHPY